MPPGDGNNSLARAAGAAAVPLLAPNGEVLSDVVVAALAELADDALTPGRASSAEAAFSVWCEAYPGQADEEHTDEAFEMFVGESAFAAAARAVLDVHLADRPGARQAFPHIYGSPVFGWYEPSAELKASVQKGLGDSTFGAPLEVLNWLYQFSIPHHIRKRFGQFYTPTSVVESMLDNVGFAGQDVLDARLIDPACGAGAYLIEATRRVLEACERAELTPTETCSAVRRIIHGLDLNPLGVLLSEAAIALMLTPQMARLSQDAHIDPLHLYATDTLVNGDLLEVAGSGDAAAIKSRTGEFADGFTHVIANPPYAKYPSRLMDETQKARFAQTTFGHPNLYGLFLQVGVELLADNGRLAYINPKSFVSGLYFRNLRRFLTKHLNLQRFDTFEKRTGLFEGVLQEVVVLTAERGEQQPTIELREFSTTPDREPAVAVEVEHESVLLGEPFDYAFFIAADPVAHRVMDCMTDGTRPLSSFGFKTATGTIVWNRLKPHVRDEAADDSLPLIWGNGIRQFRFMGAGNRAGEATHMALVPKTQNIISTGDALLVKRMTAKEEKRRLVACRVPSRYADDERGYFAENHVNVVRAAENAALDLDIVLGLLNSSLFDYVFRTLNGNTNVSATELELLPVREGPELKKIGELAASITAAEGVRPMAEARLNQLVYQLYGVGADDIACIEGTTELAVAS